MIPNHTQQWSSSGIKIMHPTCACVLIYCGVKEKGFESQVNGQEGATTTLRREMKTAQKKGMLKLPKMKSKARKVWKKIFDLGFITWSPDGRWWLLDVCRAWTLGIMAKQTLGRSAVLGMDD